MTVHDFDMARYVIGSEVTEVYAAGAVRITPELAAFGDATPPWSRSRTPTGA
jgi:myo-inositol 2-dehydrogenase/D-chiro-inositol 1-dehydrogenase